MGELFAKENGMIFLECSAKTKENIQQAFEETCYQIFQNHNLLENTKPSKNYIKFLIYLIVGLDDDTKQLGSSEANGDNETYCFCL